MRTQRIAVGAALLLEIAACKGSDLEAEANLLPDAAPSDAAVLVSSSGRDAGADATTMGATPGEDAAAAADAAIRDAGPTFRHPYAITGLLGTGQSLSVGLAGLPLLSTTQPYHNVRLEDSVADPSYAGAAAMVPMVAPLRALTDGGDGGIEFSQYPNNIWGETPSESAANEISALSLSLDPGDDYPSATSNVGEGGQALSVIDKGGTGNAYAQSIREATVLAGLAKAAGKTFGYGAVFLTHGEIDFDNTMYESGIVQLQADYDVDLKAATGQLDTGPIPIILSPQSARPDDAMDAAASTVEAWQASVDHPSLIVCAGPKYQYEYASDSIHLPSSGYVRLGEKYAEVYVQQVARGIAWHPLQPLSVTRATPSSNELVVHLDVAHPPLSWDPTLTRNHVNVHPAWYYGNGFEVTDATGELTIQSVMIEGTDVHIFLAAAPGPSLTVAYAMTQDAPAPQFATGTVTGRHGALRDSDPFVGRDAETIAVTATNGSATVTAVTPGAFVARANHDVVTGGGVPDGVSIASRSGDSVTLSSNWTGASGTAMLTFAHEQRNYLVQFSLPVP